MSPAAIRRLLRVNPGAPGHRFQHRHDCIACRVRRARFRYRGEVRADRDHTLCFKCFRAEVNRQRARRFGMEGAARVGEI